MQSDAVLDGRDGGPWLNDDCGVDGTGRDFLVFPKEAATEEALLDGLGGGTSRLAKRRSADREMTCEREGGKGNRSTRRRRRCVIS